LPAESTILDGEVVALQDGGVSSFQALQNALRDGSGASLAYYAFDILYLNGEDLRRLPLVERKERLKELIAAAGQPQLAYSEHFVESGDNLLEECCRRGLEGIISKRAGRPYVAGRTTDWLKIKCLLNEELVIGGFTASTAAERGFGALLLGYFADGQFVYAGRVGTGFDNRTLTDLRRRLDKIVQPRSPFVTIPARERVPGIQWVRPQLVAQIAFSTWTDAGVVRHASFLGLREDKPAKEVARPESLAGKTAGQRKEEPSAMPRKSNKPRSAKEVPAATATDVSDLPVQLTNPQRVLWADVGLTKADLARYYATIADWILPHLAGRPLSMLRCPEGQRKPCFFQKHAAAGTPDALRRIDIDEKHETEVYLIADDLPGLLSLAQMSILEIHPWGSRADRLEQPDRIIFDLDPSDEVPWRKVVAAAREVRDSLEKLGLVSFVKTTGGKGLHVVAPLSPRRHEWPAVKAFTRAVAQHFADEHPDRFTANIAKAARKGKIFIDYLRNDRGATAIAPYSTRTKPKATVSTPLAWDELSARIKSDHFRVDNVLTRLKSQASDPWQGFFAVKQQLPKFVEE
jgi:bifunctional non-homologous end joining protein LigD